MDVFRLFSNETGGGLTLTGSYLMDQDLYPGFWTHDMPIVLGEKLRAQRTVTNTLKKSQDG